MVKPLIAVLVFATTSPLVLSQVTLSVSLDSDAPAGIVTADVFADVVVSDAWTAGGIRAVAMNGATFRYGGVDDPNTSYPDHVTGPYGYGPVTDLHVTCFSRPRINRNSPNRFNINADADLWERYSPSGPISESLASDTEVNLVWYANPYPGPEAPSTDGYIGRISLSFSFPPGATVVADRLDLVP